MNTFDPGRAVLPNGEVASAEDMTARMSKPGAHYRQGDVLVVRTKAIPSHAAELPRDNGGVVLAYGEVTGHSHQLRGANVTMFRDSAGHEFVKTTAPEKLGHEEHSAVTTPVGEFELGQQVRYEPTRLLREAD